MKRLPKKARISKQRAPEHAKEALIAEVRRLQKAEAVLTAVHFAANHDVSFGASDAISVVLSMVQETLNGLDQLEVTL